MSRSIDDSGHHSGMTLFFAFLALGGMALVVLAPVTCLALPNSTMARDIRSYGLIGGFVAAAVAMLGSLYLSEVVGFEPCRFCWYQRYFMYPAAVVLGIAVFAKRPKLGWVGVGLAAIGFPISIYHRLEQARGSSIGSSCDVDNPCWARYVNELGWITIPTMAAVAFALVCTLVPLSLRASSRPQE